MPIKLLIPPTKLFSFPTILLDFRQKRSAPKEEPEKMDEEEWNMKDVIFVEDSRNMPIGRVIKVDGPHTVVHFPVSGSASAERGGSGGAEKPAPPPAPPAPPPVPPTTTSSSAPTPPPMGKQ